MKASLFFSTVAVAFVFTAAPLRADELHPAAASADMQALVAQLLQAVTAAPSEPAPVLAAAPAGAVAPVPKAIPRATSSLQTGRLMNGSLRTASLAPSAPLGGRGMTGGVARLNDEDWRLLFPVKQP